MSFWRLLAVGAFALLSGCVVGYGQCQFMQPLKTTLTGRVHFKEYPTADGMDNVPVLALDRTAYVYAPAQTLQCLPVNDVQLVGVSEFPHDAGEDSHVSVLGKLFQAGSARQHTSFLVDVIMITPLDKGK